MEEEELDPAFLDMPSPSMLSNSFNELGAGFGSSLSHGDDLSNGFGSALDSYHQSGDELSPPSTPPGHDSPGDALGHDLDEQLSTPRRRGASSSTPSPNSHRLSLAFELASAASPGRQSSRELLRELGIEEEEGGSSGSEEAYESDELEEQSERDELQSGGGELGLGGSRALRRPSQQLQDAFPGSATPRRIASTSSATYHSSGASSVDAVDEEASREELEASLAESTSALESSMQTTGVFLSHLRQHTTAEVDPTSSSTSSAPPTAPVDYTDRQPILESLASSVIKSMYDVAKQREGQVRELVEIERIFARNEVGWQAALAQLDELPRDAEEEEVASAGVDGPPSLASEQEPSSRSTSEDLSPPVSNGRVSNGRLSPSSAEFAHPRPAPPPPASTTSNTLTELSSLRNITTSLISALSSINEITQVNQAATGEAGRKLRALRGHLGTTKEDLQASERSEVFVREFEAREERRVRVGGKTRAQEAREEMELAGRALEEGWREAQRMLSVTA